jgi:hypothetical protein
MVMKKKRCKRAHHFLDLEDFVLVDDLDGHGRAALSVGGMLHLGEASFAQGAAQQVTPDVGGSIVDGHGEAR